MNREMCWRRFHRFAVAPLAHRAFLAWTIRMLDAIGFVISSQWSVVGGWRQRALATNARAGGLVVGSQWSVVGTRLAFAESFPISAIGVGSDGFAQSDGAGKVAEAVGVYTASEPRQ